MLARWSGWGGIPQVFDEANDQFTEARQQIRALLRTDEAWAAARRTTLNAHYTSAEVVDAIWLTVAALGVAEGTVLEPGCGSGNFIGFAPPGLSLTGVELDTTTAEIAKHLYGPTASIHAGRFEDMRFDDGSFDAVVGNVPFAKVTPSDTRHNPHKLSLHNYFIAKSLHLTAPGGTVALLTSRYTLDAKNPTARRAIHELADLVGAVRLPARAFAASSGTDVVCDLLILHRREGPSPDVEPSWIETVPFADSAEVSVNQWYRDHPELVVGRLDLARGMYREHELTVRSNGNLRAGLDAALHTVVERARAEQLLHAPSRARTRTTEIPAPSIDVGAGSIIETASGFGRVTSGRVEPFDPRYAKDAPELRRLIGLRDAARSVLDAQVDSADDDALRAAQEELRRRYDSYVRIYGPINRFKVVPTGRTDPETGEPRTRRLRPRLGGFRDDPDWPLVAALEVFDEDTQTASHAAIFTKRVVNAPTTRLGADTPDEALAVSLDETGTVDLERISSLLGTSIDEVRPLLGSQVFDDPEAQRLVPAAEYLSGDVRQKLRTAEAAAEADASYQPNVEALRDVLPMQLEPGEISARLGTPWIEPEDIEEFCREVFGARLEIEYLSSLGRWELVAPAGRRGVAFRAEWGTDRADAATLLRASLNQQLYTVYDETEDGRRVRNDAETIAAREKQDALAIRFSTWIWEDPSRAARLADRYNQLFNSHVPPSPNGDHLSLPGLAAGFVPHQHQRDAVARLLLDGRALLAHAVGAGKTATMVMAATEMRRLGMVSKPAVVVPNHMLEQFAREWVQLYPTAQLLIADRERLSKDRRKEFVARATTGTWDGIIFSHSSFARLQLGPDLQQEYLSERLERLRAALAESRNGKALSVKRLERRVASEEERLRSLQANHRKDDGVRFEETGVDFVMVDEAHAYKNKRVDSAIDGMAHPGSQRAEDLDAKLWHLRRRHGPRVVAFATATPVANSMAEMWVMQSFLQPDVLHAAGIAPFDAWAANFGRTVTKLELAPDGASWRLSTRFAQFENIPELMRLWRQVADVRTASDLDLVTPELVGGGPQTVVVPGTDELHDFVSTLANRAEQVRSRAVDPTDDNMLKITGDGRRAALDLRLVGEHPGDGGKLAVAADRIAQIAESSADRRYQDAAGREHDRPGALQIVFCDTSTPTSDRWNAYDELRTLLVDRGLDPDAVRFVHEAKTDDAKASLFAACRDGRVAVLIGSTEKMGVGTNVQARAIALHHIDCPWRPADIEQREGRIVRQGNQNPEVSIYRYVTEGSFDTYMWQTLERKAGFIGQVTGGRITARQVDDIDDDALSYAEVKALATGNPLIMEKAGVDSEVSRLQRLEHAHTDEQRRLRRAVDAAQRQVASTGAKIARLEDAIEIRTETRADAFQISLGEATLMDRSEAGERLKALGLAQLDQTHNRDVSREVGTLGNLPLHLETTRTISPEVIVTIGDDLTSARWSEPDWASANPSRLITGLERRIHSLDDDLAGIRDRHDAALDEASRAKSRLGERFEHGPELERLRRRQQEIDGLLNPAPPEAAAPATDPPAQPAGITR